MKGSRNQECSMDWYVRVNKTCSFKKTSLKWMIDSFRGGFFLGQVGCSNHFPRQLSLCFFGLEVWQYEGNSGKF